MVTAIDEHGVTVSSAKTKEEKRIDAETVILVGRCSRQRLRSSARRGDRL